MKKLQVDPENGKVKIDFLELNIAHHCNLNCRRCSHLSPTASKYFMQPERVLKDLTILGKFCQSRQIRLLGGEPLLHPELMQIIEGITESGISEYVTVCTNGMLLENMSDLFWRKVDQIKISLYPGYRIAPHRIKRYCLRAEKFGVKLILRYINRFRESYSELGTTDKKLIQRIFSTCQITHSWGCYTVHEGYFYRCSLSLLLPLYLPELQLKNLPKDGLKLEDKPDFAHRLQHFLQSDVPLAACQYCLGSVGKRFFPERSAAGPSENRFTSEELLDRRYLKFYEIYGNRRFSPWLRQLGLPLKTVLNKWRSFLK